MAKNYEQEKEEIIARLVRKLESLGDEALLDDTVHDIASGLASAANNGGYGSQLDFILEHERLDIRDVAIEIEKMIIEIEKEMLTND